MKKYNNNNKIIIIISANKVLCIVKIYSVIITGFSCYSGMKMRIINIYMAILIVYRREKFYNFCIKVHTIIKV